MFKNLRFSLKKSKILTKIRKAVENQEFDADSVIKQAMKTAVQGKIQNDKDIYIEELLSFLSKDEITLTILKKHTKNFNDVRNMIGNLELNGAGQIIKGHYVAVSAVAFGDTLDFLCEHWNKDGFDTQADNRKNSNQIVAYKILQSF